MKHTNFIKAALVFLSGCSLSSAMWTPLVSDRAGCLLLCGGLLAVVIVIDWIEP